MWLKEDGQLALFYECERDTSSYTALMPVIRQGDSTYFQQATYILILRFWCDVMKRFDLQIALQFHLIMHHQLPRLFITYYTLVASANIGMVR